MHNISKPAISYERLYRSCTNVNNENLERNLLSIFQTLKTAAAAYNTSARAKNLHTLNPLSQTHYYPVTQTDLIKLYTQKMLSKEHVARKRYNQLLIAAKGRCPFCSHNLPKTLDHYLGKAEFPEFSILPINLVPCCRDCNHAKLDTTPSSEENQFIHPYYDDLSKYQWLEAKLFFIDESPIVSFYINQNAPDLDDTLYLRLENQFAKLQLNDLYIVQASNELSSINFALQELHKLGGATEVRRHLEVESMSRMQSNKNSWQAAFYRCISQDDEFCEMQWTL